MEFSGADSGRGEEIFPNFLELSGGLHPLENNQWHIIHSLVKPSELPLPGDSQVWETPKRRSPECEFGDATALLKSLKLNPDAAVFEFTSPTSTNPPNLDNDMERDDVIGNIQGMNLSDKLSPQSRKLSASSAPFVPTHNNVPNIQIPFPTSHAQTIHINNLTANLNYHVQPQVAPAHIPQQQPTVTLSGAQTIPISSSKIVSGAGVGVSAGQVVGPPGISFAGGSTITGSPGISFTGGSTITGGGGVSAGPMPFTVNGAYPEFINQYHTPQQFQPPVLVYQEPSLNHTLYYANSNQQQGVPFTKDQQQQQQQPQQPKYTGPPIVSVKEKLAAPEEEIIPTVGQQQVVSSTPPQQQYNHASVLQYNNKVDFVQQAQYSHQAQVQQPASSQTQVGQMSAYQQTQVGQMNYQAQQVGQIVNQPQVRQPVNMPHVGQIVNLAQAGDTVRQAQPVHLTNQPTVHQNRVIAAQAGSVFDSRDIQPQAQQHHAYTQHQQPQQQQQIQQQQNQQQNQQQQHQQQQNQQQQHQQQQQLQQQQNQPQQQHQQQQQQINQYQQQNIVGNTLPFTQQHQQQSEAMPSAFGGLERASAIKLPSPPREPRYNAVDLGMISLPATESADQHNMAASISFGSYDEQIIIEPEPTKQIDRVTVERTPSVPFQSAPIQAAPVQESPEQASPVQPAPVQVSPNQAAPIQAASIEAAPVQAEPVQTVPAAPLTWANKLFTKLEQTQAANEKPTARIQPFSAVGSSLGGAAPSPVPPTVPQDIADIKAKKFGEFLLDYNLSHHNKSMLPAGLSNRSNWCFVNAILQALVACPPFYNIFKQINLHFGVQGLNGTKTSMIQSILAFVKDFCPLDTLKAPKKEKKRKKEDVRTGDCIEPASVYKMLLNLPQKDCFQVIEGRQEDAEEFLTCLLNGISDEMAEVMKMLPREERVVQEVEMEGVEGYQQDLEEHHDPEDWQEVDSKGRSCVTRRAVNHDDTTPITPIQSLALGMCRSSLRCETGEISATLQPFFTLQLDIQHPDVTTLQEALLKNFDSEDIEGYKNQKTNQVVKATRSLNLEELPVILILHMKRFVYDANTGGVQKTLKPVQFSTDLEIPKTVLSNETRNKFSTRQRLYKLFAVVCHNGREATKGHYVTDVYHTGYGCWLHCDDAIVTETAEESVLTPSHTSTPYILFYRRNDTVTGGERKEPKPQKQT